MTVFGREHLDRMLSLAVGVAAVCAVGISLYQAKIMREQQRASAWPYLVQSNNMTFTSPYTRTVENAGVGPARVRWFLVLVDGKPVAKWSDAIRSLTGEGDAGYLYSSFGRGHVVVPGSTTTLLTIPRGPRAVQFWSRAQTRLATIVCYCSVYNECWRADDREAEPASVTTCDQRPAGEFAE